MAGFDCGLLWISWDFKVALSLLCAYKGFDYEEYVDNMVVYQVCRLIYEWYINMVIGFCNMEL
jgi:hypothetical protein